MKITRTFQVDPKLYEQLDRLALVTNTPKGALINQAIAQLVESKASNLPLKSANFVYDGLEAIAQ
jgi:predicted transcriptional regulator